VRDDSHRKDFMEHLGQLDVPLGHSRKCFAMCSPVDCFYCHG
jgi:hypothetical protein